LDDSIVIDEQNVNSNNKRDSSSFELSSTIPEEVNKINDISSSDYNDTSIDSTLLTHQEPSKTSLNDVEDDNTDVIGG
jgi:hypothetical protein